MNVAALARMLVRPRRRQAITVLLVHLSATAVALAGPPLVGAAVDRLATGRGAAGLVAAFVAVTAAAAGLTAVAAGASAGLAEVLLADLRTRVVDAVAARPVAAVERAGTADLLTRATADVEAISVALRTGVPRMVIAALTVVLTVAALVLVAPSLAAASLAGVLVAAPPLYWYLRRCGSVYDRERAANAERVRTFHDGATTAALVRAYARELERRAAQEGADGAWFDAAMAGARTRVVARAGVGAGVAVALASVVAVGALAVDGGTASVGTLTAAVLYLLRAVEPIEMLVHELDELQTARAAAARVAEALDDAPPPPISTSGPAGPRPARGDLRARGLRFAYTVGHDVLHDVDVDVHAGEKVALVGPSGAGKSTLARILAGVHPPDAGTVELGGVDLRALDPLTLRRWVVVLEQEGHVFTGTIADNLRLAAPDAPDDHLLDALSAVGGSWVHDLPGDLHTHVGAGGRGLAPVQARQLALARVLLADPAVVVLDEATAGFDAGTARHAESGLGAALVGRTVVVVSHRLESARCADRVLLVVDGRITESGSHDGLVSLGGRYASLWHAWATPA